MSFTAWNPGAATLASIRESMPRDEAKRLCPAIMASCSEKLPCMKRTQMMGSRRAIMPAIAGHPSSTTDLMPQSIVSA